MNTVLRRVCGLSRSSVCAGLYQGGWASMATASVQEVPVSQEVPSFDPSHPFALVKDEIDAVSERIRRSVVSEIPVLDRAAEYFLRVGSEGKRMRPSMVLLLSTALSRESPPADRTDVDTRPASITVTEIRRRQQRIAEIAEILHVASLLHDDVIDNAATRRGIKSLNVVVGNKLAILAGDFLLARISVTLAGLRDSDVILLMSGILEHLVTGEIMQMTSTPEDMLRLDHYAAKTFRKTAALMANSAKSVALLGGHSPEVCELALDYGKHLGMAFQVVDDILDFTATSDVLGKPALNDLKSGIATAPVLFAVEEFPALQSLIVRKFKDNGDIEEAVRMVERSQGIQKARDLASEHAKRAAQAIENLPPAENIHSVESRRALLNLTELVLNRSK